MIVLAVLAVSCTTVKLTPEEKNAIKAAQIQQIDSMVTGRHFGVEVDAVFPQRGPMKRLNYDYGIQVHGDTLRSYLPYFGRAYQVPYGGGKGLDFEDPIKRWTIKDGKNGQKQLTIWVENSEDAYVYTLKVYAGGNVDLTVDSRQRERIRFTGKITAEAER